MAELLALKLGDDAAAALQAGPGARPDDLAIPQEAPTPLRINTNVASDRRARQSTNLTTFPFRAIGALSGNGNTQSSGCSGWKIGPRAVATAAHCVMDAAGNIAVNGFFNPGQTNTTATNGVRGR